MKLLVVTGQHKDAAGHARTRALSGAFRSRGHDVFLIGPGEDLVGGIAHLSSGSPPGRVAGKACSDAWFDLIVEDLNPAPLRVARWVKSRPVLVLPPDLFPPSGGDRRAPDYLFRGFMGRRRARCYTRAFFALPDEPARDAVAALGVDGERIRVVGAAGEAGSNAATETIPAPDLPEAERAAWRGVMEDVLDFTLEIIESHRAWY